MVKYCGFEIKQNRTKEDEITPEQTERLYNFLHANLNMKDFISMNQEQLNEFARNNFNEWF